MVSTGGLPACDGSERTAELLKGSLGNVLTQTPTPMHLAGNPVARHCWRREESWQAGAPTLQAQVSELPPEGGGSICLLVTTVPQSAAQGLTFCGGNRWASHPVLGTQMLLSPLVRAPKLHSP